MSNETLFIPPEIHRMVVQHLKDEDLCNYRLVCKLFADIGAEEFFHEIVFHASLESISKLAAISKHPTLCTYVRNVVWDTNRWDLGFDLSDGLSARRAWEEYQIATLETPRASKFKLYLKRAVEESQLLTAGGQLTFGPLSQIFGKLQNLEKILILNGRLDCNNRKHHKNGCFCGNLAAERKTGRGEMLYALTVNNLGPAVHELWTSLLAAPRMLKKLRVHAVHWRAFLPAYRVLTNADYWGRNYMDRMFGGLGPPNPLNHPCPHLTSFHLTLMTFDEDEYNESLSRPVEDGVGSSLRAFLRGLPKLESLQLSLEPPQGLHQYSRNFLAFHDGISSGRTWPQLRKLSLQYFNISEEQLNDLIISHSETLQELRLADICLDQSIGVRNDATANVDQPPSDWIRVLTSFREHLRLKKAKFSLFLYSSPKWAIDLSPCWSMMETLGDTIERYLVHGGPCPLTIENTYNPMSEDEMLGFEESGGRDDGNVSENSSDINAE